jgi:hypothetical protein
MSRARAVPQDLRPDARSRDADAQYASPPVAVPPQPDALLALQASIGNHAVARLLMREPAATEAPAGGGEVRVVERLPTIPEPGVEYIVQPPEKRYDFEVTIHEKPMRFRELTPEQTIAKLRAVWRLCHDDLDTGRAENERLVKRRADHWVAAFWSDTLGGVEVPDPDMWNEVGRGPLYEVVQVLNATEETLRAKWERGEASIDRGLGPGLENNPYMQEALAFDATRERIKSATEKLEKAAAELRERQRRLDAYVEGSIRGAQRAISGIKVTIVVLGAGAGGAGASFARGAGYLGQAAASAGTTGFLGSTEEFFTQVGEMRIGEREDWDFDFGKIAKRGTKDVVNGFVGGVIGGKFSQVLKGRIGGWASGLSDEVLTAHGITREQLVTNGEKLFIDWVAGSVASSPFTTASGVLMDRALEGKWKVKSFDEFTGLVFDDMVQSGAMGGFLTYGGHAMSGTPSITSGGDGGGGGGGGRGGGGGGGGGRGRGPQGGGR